MKTLISIVAAALLVALVPTAAAGQPCTTPPKNPVEAALWAVECQLERLPDAADLEPDVAVQEIDLTWLNACPGPWGHEERTQIGPVVIVTYQCDDPDV